MDSTIAQLLSEHSSQLDNIRKDINHSILKENNVGNQSDIEAAAKTKSYSYVMIYASQENFVKKTLTHAITHVISNELPVNILPSYFSFLTHDHFQRIHSDSSLPSFEEKVILFEKLFLGAKSNFIYALPLNGRTLRKENFDLIEAVFKTKNKIVSDSILEGYQKDLANGRNDIAHGHVDPIVFGKGKNCTDIIKLIEAIEKISTNLAVEFDEIKTNKLYKR